MTTKTTPHDDRDPNHHTRPTSVEDSHQQISERNRWNKCNFTKGIPDHVCIDWLARQIIDADEVHFWITYLIDNLGPIEKEGIVKGGIQVYDEDELHKSYAMDLEEQKTEVTREI